MPWKNRYVFYMMLIQELLGSMRDEAMRSDTALPRKRFSTNVLKSDLRRPWGRKKEHVFCYAITLEALLKDTFPNKYSRLEDNCR